MKIRLLPLLPFLMTTFAYAGNADKKCYDWLGKYLAEGPGPEIKGYGPDPKIAFDEKGNVSVDSTHAIILDSKTEGKLTCSEVARTGVKPKEDADGAWTYFNLKVCKDEQGQLVRAKIQAPVHLRGMGSEIDGYDDYSVEFDHSAGDCTVSRIYGGAAFTPITGPDGKESHVQADFKACSTWNRHWKENRNVDPTKLTIKNTAQVNWVKSWIKTDAPWFRIDALEYLGDFVADQCKVLADFEGEMAATVWQNGKAVRSPKIAK